MKKCFLLLSVCSGLLSCDQIFAAQEPGSSAEATIDALELHKAAAENDVAKITELLAAEADPNARDSEGKTPLHCVKFGAPGGVETIKALLEAGTRKRAKDAEENCPLHCAARRGTVEEVDLLIGQDEFYDRWDSDGPNNKEGRTPLHEAVIHKNRTVIARLYGEERGDEGFPWDVKEIADRTGIEEKPGAEEEYRLSGLHLATIHGDLDTVKALLSAGERPWKVDSKGRTALHYAAILGEETEEIARELIEAGAEASRVDLHGKKASEYATWAPTIALLEEKERQENEELKRILDSRKDGEEIDDRILRRLREEQEKVRQGHDTQLVPELTRITLFRKNGAEAMEVINTKYADIAADEEVQGQLMGLVAAPPDNQVPANKVLTNRIKYATGSESRVKGAKRSFDLAANGASNIFGILVRKHNILDSLDAYKKALDIMGMIRRITHKNAMNIDDDKRVNFSELNQEKGCIGDTIDDDELGERQQELREFFKGFCEVPDALIAKLEAEAPDKDTRWVYGTTSVYTFYELDGGRGNPMRIWRFGFDGEGKITLVKIAHREQDGNSIAYHLSPLQEAWRATNEADLKTGLLKFIHRMSCSSTYNRGQAAITLWIVRGFARAKGYELELTGGWALESKGYPYDVCALFTLSEDEFVEKHREDIGFKVD